ncbi:MAG: PGF-pre-PGF domain-containing protein [Candidatus Methanoperedens sp.]|nr:PGF-pre-PGF domain-containing protein [Candidatus Methanoperedens sp.]
MKLYPLILVAVFAIGIASAQVSIVNDTLFNLDNNAYLKVLATQNSTNITIFKSTDSPTSTLQFYINGTPIRFKADTNKTLSNISYNSATDIVTYTGNGATGSLNVSARMNLTQRFYNLKVDGTINQTIQSDGTGWVTFNYTGWSPNQHEFEISRVVTTYIPPTPASLGNSTGNFFVNHSWQAGNGNITDSFSVKVNGTWHNGTTSYYNNSGLAPHGWSNISVYAFNSSGLGTMNVTLASQNTQVPNNAPVQAGIGSKSINENQALSFTVSATDADNDPITYGTNATKGSFNSGTGQFTWTPTFGESGSYVWSFNSSDMYGGVDSEPITITVSNIPLTITSRSPSVDPASTEGSSWTFNLTLNRTANVTWYINGTSVQTNTSTTLVSYTNSTAIAGYYNVTAIVSDAYDTASTMWNWTVNPVPTYIPPSPVNLANLTGNFFVNHSWQSGNGNVTDSFNVNVNGTWHNGTTSYYNNSGLSPHGWSNISVYAFNSSGLGRMNSTPASQNTQVPNNAPVQAGIGSKSINENQTMSFTVSATDADNDTITYGTNATKGTLNTSTGQFTWTPTFGESGSYVWSFNSSDVYGGVDSETISVTVTNIPLTITSRSPSGDPTSTEGNSRSFNLTLNRTANVTWYIDGTSVQTNSSITAASYTNRTASAGIYNVTAIVSDAYDTASTMWNWTVTPVPIGAPSITSFAPFSPVNDTAGAARTFNIIVNQTVDVTWSINGTTVFNQTNVTGSSYTNTSAALGVWNVTATANNANGAVSKQWIWNVTAAKTTGINITSPANNSVNDTGFVNVTVTLDIPGTALLNWEGVNESMNGAGTDFYKNKTGLLSGNYSFRVYDLNSSSISETRIITVNRTTATDLSNYTDPVTGNVNRTVNLIAPGGNSSLTIFNGTNATLNGTPITGIIIDALNRVNSTFVVNLSGNEKLIGENLSLGPAGAQFSPDIQIRLNYTDAQLTAAGITASTLKVKFYNTSTNNWIEQIPYTLNTTGKYITANVSHFSTFALIGTAAAPVSPATLIATPGGGGGAGTISPEPVNNIDMFEITEEYLGANVPASYIYTTPDLVISEVLITPSKNFGATSIRVEMLKDISKIEGVTPPEGIVYKYANIWVGAKELESEQGIIDAFIGFKVDRSWLAENNLGEGSISLLRWDGSKWVSLETEPRSLDEQFVYYMAKTSGFSPFAIVAGSPYPSATIAAVETPVLIKPTLQKITESGVLLWGYIVISVIFIGFVLFILMRYKKPVKVYEKDMEIKPGDADGWYNRGFDLYEQGNYDEAIKAYDKAIDIIHKSGKEKKD